MAREFYKCQFNECDEKVHIDEMVEIEVNGKKKRFHKDCYKKYEMKKTDREAMDKLCKFIEIKFMDYKDGTKITTNMIRRLQGIRSGNKIIRRGDKIPYESNKGNPYKLILLTALKYEDIIFSGLRGKTFKTEQQKFNYICAILENKVLDVKKSLIERKKEKERLDKMSEDKNVFKEVPKYKSNKENNDDKLKNRFKDMW